MHERLKLLRTRLLLAVLLGIAFLAPFATASVSDVSIRGEGVVQNGQDLFIPSGRPIDAILSFAIESGIDTLHVDLRSLDQRLSGADVRSLSTTNCVLLRCELRVILYVNPGNTNLAWRYGLPGAELTTNTLAVRVDTTPPAFLRLGTPGCDQACSLPVAQPATVRAHFTETGSGLDATNVILSVAGQQFAATTCTGASCDVPLVVPQSAIQNGNVTVTVVRAQDRVGNSATGTMQGTFSVDNNPPVIESLAIQTTNGAPTGTATGPFTIVAVVNENSIVTATADISAISDVDNAAARPFQCTTGTPRRCTLTVTPTIGDLGEHTIEVTVRDAAGLLVTDTVTVNILEQSSSAFTGTFTATGTIKPGSLDLGIAKRFTQRLFITDIDLRASTYGVDIIDIQTDRCTFRTGGRSITLSSEMKLIGRPSDPTFMISLNPVGEALASSGNDLDIECAFAITAVKDNTIYPAKRTTIKTTLKLVDNPDLPARMELIKRKAREDADKNARAVNSVRGMYGSLATSCTAIDAMVLMSNTYRSIQVALGSNPITLPAAQTQHAAGNAFERSIVKRLSKSTFRQSFCNQLMCAQDWTGLRTGTTGPLAGSLNALEQGIDTFVTPPAVLGNNTEEKWNRVAGYTTGNTDAKRSFMNPYKSLPIAVAQVCVPAIISHMETISQIQCDYSACLENDVAIGAPLSACEGKKSYDTCRYIGQGVFWITPLAVIQTIRDNIITILNNPASILYAVGADLCHLYDAPPQPMPKGICSIPWGIQQSIELAKMKHQLEQNYLFMQRFGQGCRNLGPPLEDDFYSIGSDYTDLSCNPALCAVGDVQNGRFIASGDPDNPTYRVVTTDSSGKTTLTDVPPNQVSRTIPASTRQELRDGLQRAAAITAGVEPITVASPIDAPTLTPPRPVPAQSPTTPSSSGQSSSGQQTTAPGTPSTGTPSPQQNQQPPPLKQVGLPSGREYGTSNYAAGSSYTGPVDIYHPSTYPLPAYPGLPTPASPVRFSTEFQAGSAYGPGVYEYNAADGSLVTLSVFTSGRAGMNIKNSYGAYTTTMFDTAKKAVSSTSGVWFTPETNPSTSSPSTNPSGSGASNPANPVDSSGASGTSATTGTNTETNQQGNPSSSSQNVGANYDPAKDPNVGAFNQFIDRVQGLDTATYDESGQLVSANIFDTSALTAAYNSYDAVMRNPQATDAQRAAAVSALNEAMGVAEGQYNAEVDRRNAEATEEAQRKAKRDAEEALRSSTQFRLTRGVQNALAFQGAVSQVPWLNKMIKPGLGLYDLEQVDWIQWTDAEENFINNICLSQDSVKRGDSVAGFTADHRVGLALSAHRIQVYSDELVALIEDFNAIDWDAIDVEAPILPDVSEQNYTYVVTGVLNTDPRETTERGEFRVYIYGSGEEIEVSRDYYSYGQPTSLANSETVTSDYRLDEVCVELSDDIEDLLANTERSGNVLCVPVRGQN